MSDAALYRTLETNRSVQQSNKTLEKSIKRVLEDMETITVEKTEYKPLVEAAKAVLKISEIYLSYIDSLKTSVATDHQSIGNINLLTICKEEYCSEIKARLSNTTIANKVFLDKKTAEGLVLEEKLNAVRTDYLNLVASLWSEESRIPGTIFVVSSRKEKTLQKLRNNFFVSSPALFEQSTYKQNSNWAEHTFRDLPRADLLLLLNRTENDILLLTYTTIDFLDHQIGRMCNLFSNLNRPSIGISAFDYTIKVGQPFKTRLVVYANGGATIDFEAAINGKKLPKLNSFVIYEFTPKTAGKHDVTVDYWLMNDNGFLETYSDELSFEVTH